MLIVTYVTYLHKIVNGIFDIIPKTLNVQNEVNFTFVLYLQIYGMVTEVPFGKNSKVFMSYFDTVQMCEHNF